MPSNAFVTQGLTCYGQKFPSGIFIAIGSTVTWSITAEDPLARTALDLTGATVVLALSALDIQQNPISPAIIARQAIIAPPPSNGLATATWLPVDTAGSPAGVKPVTLPLASGLYGIELWVVDASGERIQLLSFGTITLTPASYLPSSITN